MKNQSTQNKSNTKFSMVRSQLSKISFFSGGKPFRDRETRSFTKYAKKLNYLERDLIDICNILQWFL